MNVVIRTTLRAEALAPQIRRIVQAMDPTLPIVNLRSMDDVFAESVSRPRFLAQLLGLFAGLALLLASIGTYGILSYSVTERRREIGIHMALGASRGNVLGMILGQGMRLTAAGLVAGLAAAFVLTRLLRTQLFNVKPSDPATLTGVAGFIALVALVACYIPASRATRVDPMVGAEGRMRKIGELVNWWIRELSFARRPPRFSSTRGSACEVNSPIHEFTNSRIHQFHGVSPSTRRTSAIRSRGLNGFAISGRTFCNALVSSSPT